MLVVDHEVGPLGDPQLFQSRHIVLNRLPIYARYQVHQGEVHPPAFMVALVGRRGTLQSIPLIPILAKIGIEIVSEAGPLRTP